MSWRIHEPKFRPEEVAEILGVDSQGGHAANRQAVNWLLPSRIANT